MNFVRCYKCNSRLIMNNSRYKYMNNDVIDVRRYIQLVRNNNNNNQRVFTTTTTTTNTRTFVDTTTMFPKHFPIQYIRAMDTSNFDPITLQRIDISFNKQNGKVLVSSKKQSSNYTINHCTFDETYYYITWNDGVVSKFTIHWLDSVIEKWKGNNNNNNNTNTNNNTIETNYKQQRRYRKCWSNLSEQMIRDSDTFCISFDKIVSINMNDNDDDDHGMNVALTTLYEYGFVIVSNTPIHDNGVGVAVLAAAFGGGCNKHHSNSLLMQYRNGQLHDNQIILPHGTDGPLRTLYGTVWSTSSLQQTIGASIADSSYGNDALPLHTDMTYQRDPPGLQIFTMIQPAIMGGESILCDGYTIAKQLQHTNPIAFDTLSQTIQRYRCIDYTTGWYMEASGPIIGLDNYNNNDITMIRHNDLDRLPYLPSPTTTSTNSTNNVNYTDYDYTQLQEAHDAWDDLLSNDLYRLVIQLQPGETLVVANQRCLHGRYSFTTTPESPRIISGCYVSQDELSSRFRMMGYDIY